MNLIRLKQEKNDVTKNKYRHKIFGAETKRCFSTLQSEQAMKKLTFIGKTLQA